MKQSYIGPSPAPGDGVAIPFGVIASDRNAFGVLPYEPVFTCVNAGVAPVMGVAPTVTTGVLAIAAGVVLTTCAGADVPSWALIVVAANVEGINAAAFVVSSGARAGAVATALGGVDTVVSVDSPDSLLFSNDDCCSGGSGVVAAPLDAADSLLMRSRAMNSMISFGEEMVAGELSPVAEADVLTSPLPRTGSCCWCCCAAGRDVRAGTLPLLVVRTVSPDASSPEPSTSSLLSPLMFSFLPQVRSVVA